MSHKIYCEFGERPAPMIADDGERGFPRWLNFGERGKVSFTEPDWNRMSMTGPECQVFGPPEGGGGPLLVGPPDGWGYFGPPEGNGGMVLDPDGTNGKILH